MVLSEVVLGHVNNSQYGSIPSHDEIGFWDRWHLVSWTFDVHDTTRRIDQTNVSIVNIFVVAVNLVTRMKHRYCCQGESSSSLAGVMKTKRRRI